MHFRNAGTGGGGGGDGNGGESELRGLGAVGEPTARTMGGAVSKPALFCTKNREGGDRLTAL